MGMKTTQFLQKCRRPLYAGHQVFVTFITLFDWNCSFWLVPASKSNKDNMFDYWIFGVDFCTRIHFLLQVATYSIAWKWYMLYSLTSNIRILSHCPACRTSLIATRFWVVMICPIIKCLTVLEFSFILFDLCLFITIFNFILNYVPIVTFWIFTYHKIWILLIIFCFIWSYWIISLTCLEVFWSVVS